LIERAIVKQFRNEINRLIGRPRDPQRGPQHATDRPGFIKLA
jgi:hypothetical protein